MNLFAQLDPQAGVATFAAILLWIFLGSLLLIFIPVLIGAFDIGQHLVAFILDLLRHDKTKSGWQDGLDDEYIDPKGGAA